MAVNPEIGIYPEIYNPEDYIGHLTPWQIEIFAQRAMGLTRGQIGEKFGRSGNTIRNVVAYAMDRETTNPAEIVYSLIKAGKIDRARLLEDLDFEKYNLLSDRDKEVVEIAISPDNWGSTMQEMEEHLYRGSRLLGNQLRGVYKKLGVNNLLRLRVFMFLKAEREQGLQDLPQTADVLPIAPSRVTKIDELMVWGLKLHQEIHARRRKLTDRVG